MALINKLEAIGDAIRSKTGSTELLTLDEMVTAINGLSVANEWQTAKITTVYNGATASDITQSTIPISNFVNIDTDEFILLSCCRWQYNETSTGLPQFKYKSFIWSPLLDKLYNLDYGTRKNQLYKTSDDSSISAGASNCIVPLTADYASFSFDTGDLVATNTNKTGFGTITGRAVGYYAYLLYR